MTKKKTTGAAPTTLLPKHVDLFTFTSRAEWLEERRRYIGSSDAPGILGVSSYGSTPLKVWISKTEKRDPNREPEPEAEWLEWGRRQEPVIAQAFADKMNREVIDPSPVGPRHQHFAVNSKIPFAAASCDRFQRRAGEKRLGILELKNESFGSPEEWEGGPPVEHQVQVQHQFMVTDMEWGSIAVLFHGSAFRAVDVERNDAFVAKMLAAEKRFWKYVTEGRPPAPSPLDSGALSRLFPKEEPGLIVPLLAKTFVTPDGREFGIHPDELIDRRVRLMALADRVEEEIEGCNAYLKALVGNAARAVLPTGAYAAWETVDGFDVPARYQPPYRKFRVHVPKKLKAQIEALTDLGTLEPLVQPPQLTEGKD